MNDLHCVVQQRYATQGRAEGATPPTTVGGPGLLAIRALRKMIFTQRKQNNTKIMNKTKCMFDLKPSKAINLEEQPLKFEI